MLCQKEGRLWSEASSGSNEVKLWGRWSEFLLVDCGRVVFLGSAYIKICWRLGIRVGCVGSYGRNVTATELPWKHNELPPMVNIMQIASSKSQS